MNTIIIKELSVTAHIGVTDTERDDSQQLLINVIMTPLNAFSDLGDDITRTVDYYAASRKIIHLAAARPRKLIETLAVEIADLLLNEFTVNRVEVEVRKFILPDTEYVAVCYTKERTN